LFGYSEELEKNSPAEGLIRQPGGDKAEKRPAPLPMWANEAEDLGSVGDPVFFSNPPFQG